MLQTTCVTETRYVDEQRLAFGRVAELYDRVRPSYPAAVIDAVVDFAGLSESARILEVGAGTGKATVLFAERGLDVVALEPSVEMAAVARETCAEYPGVEIVEGDFERWSESEQFAAIVSAQAWHWVAPEVRYVKAHEVLLHAGTLAAIWTFPDWRSCELRLALSDAYRATAPALAPDFPMHPDSEPTSLAGDWLAETNATGLFTDQQVLRFPWDCQYTSVQYAMLLQTHQDHILLEPDQRAGLLDAIVGAIGAAGGIITVPFVTRLCLARSA